MDNSIGMMDGDIWAPLGRAREDGKDVARLVRIEKAARAVVAAADACEREDENHPANRSAAPLTRYIGAMARLREALNA